MSKERIILMYITEVSGHHRAALAIESAIRLLSPDAEILNINAFHYTNPISEKIINRLYMGILTKAPQIWDYLYDNPSVVKKIERIKKTVHKFNSPKLNNLFNEFKPDAVVCSQAFPCGMVADFKKTYHSAIPLVAVLTDYAPHSYWIYDTVDYYICPSEEIGRLLHKKGIPAGKIRPYGIPFDQKFNRQFDKDKVLRALKLKAGVPTVLLMGGGQGMGPMKAVVDSLDKARPEFQEIVVTGTNKKAYTAIQKKLTSYKKRIALFGYVDTMPELMSVSDLLITKPGGITTAEALAKKLPMVIVHPLPGQEANNTAYLIGKKAAYKVDEPREAGSVVEKLLSGPGELESLRASCAAIGKPEASSDIARLVLGLCRKKDV